MHIATLSIITTCASALVAPSTRAASNVPNLQRRVCMNKILLIGGVLPTVAGLGGPYFAFFLPKKDQVSSTVTALTKTGEKVSAGAWLAKHSTGSRDLVQGLNGDPMYLIIDEDKTIRDYAINAICTHLGCVVPFNTRANKYICPCHGSQYDQTGKVIRGPAPLSLALANVNIDKSGFINLNQWNTTDFRDDLAPWWI